jgi:hypothetical protein
VLAGELASRPEAGQAAEHQSSRLRCWVRHRCVPPTGNAAGWPARRRRCHASRPARRRGRRE